ncbi:NAC domain-containing protein 6 [Silene latifolia]|uniref:NAC domain-containing protein 6 n=1 Tax=Silene latifolia TaxID=37657 RepID=UPI003D774138
MDINGPSFELPGFRFKPTEEELLSFYLKNVTDETKMHLDIIGFLNIYKHAPWDLPGLAKIGEREWYFFVPRDRKQSNGGKPNRTTEHGYWKATGSDRKIFCLSEPKRVIGLKKTLVFYEGRAPRGSKTDWVMNEYRFPDHCVLHKDIVLCKIYRKATSMKELEQRAAMEEAMQEKSATAASCPTSPFSSSNGGATSINNGDFGPLEGLFPPTFMPKNEHIASLKIEEIEENFEEVTISSNCNVASSSNTIQWPFGKDSLEDLQVPKLGLDYWIQDPFSLQSCSPWLENWMNFSSPTLISQFL